MIDYTASNQKTNIVRTMISNGCLIWEGRSLLDNKTPIAAIATGFKETNNHKLGREVVSVYVIQQDVPPQEAINQKLDFATCGNCPLSGNNGCYVIAGFSTSSVYDLYKKGGYPPVSSAYLQYLQRYQKVLRLTAYGEIVAIPQGAIAPLMKVAATTLGYTHQWRSPLALPYLGELMASVEGETEAREAQAMGWKTYRIKRSSDELLIGEAHCVNQINSAVQCQDCRQCDGATKNIAINSHGISYKIQRIEKILKNAN